MNMAVIGTAYRGVRAILEPGGAFLDYDHFDHIEGIDRHIQLFEQAGYAHVERLWYEPPTAIVRATA